MTAEELLLGPARLKAEIARDMDNLAALRAVAEGCTSRLDLVAGSHVSGSRGKLEDLTLAIADEEEKINARIADLAEQEKRVLEVIHLVPNASQRGALLMRYIQGLGWSEIAGKLYVNKSYVYKIRRAALKTVEKILSENQKGEIRE